MSRTRNFAEVLKRRIASDATLAKAVDDEDFNAHIAQQIYDARKAAKLTQSQLAELVETHQSVIARLEDADYDGHSLTMLRRIADALGKKLRVELYGGPEPPWPIQVQTAYSFEHVESPERTWTPEINVESLS
jgi:transcriptional regulator with XRE-family HTH domain